MEQQDNKNPLHIEAKISKNMMNQFVSFLEDTFKEKYETVTAITFKLKEDEN